MTANAHPQLNAALSGRYTIERELGAGGMATVYLAQDVRHHRKVALKVLRPELSAILGAERFLAEIKTTANLQHPHILSLFDSGEAGGTVFYVMPYVEGESLRDRLKREQQLPVDDAVRIAREVLDALDYAHKNGIVHRDIKPENILLHGGHAMVADFGIALAASKVEGGTRMTETGMSLGTPHYMSPEQAMGERIITPKADIYAAGAVLYEMLTAEPPFVGATAQAIFARVLTDEPRSITLQRRTVPQHVADAVRVALQKLPADRFASAREFSEALGKVDFAAPLTRARNAAIAPATMRQRTINAAPWALAAVAIATAGWLATRKPRPIPHPTTRFTLTFSRSSALSDGTGSPLALSPDGSRIVFLGTDSVGRSGLYLRGMDREDPVLLPGTAGSQLPFFSPDGQHVGFRQDGKMRRLALAGGAAVTICDCIYLGASWGDGDVIVFAEGGRLRRVSASGGQPADLARPDSSRRETYLFPNMLPGGKAAVFRVANDSGPSLAAVTLADGVVKPLGQRGFSPHYVDGGYLLYVESDGTVFTAPFDAGRLRITGPSQPVTDNVRTGPAQVAKMGVSRMGSMAYIGGTSGGDAELVLVDRSGHGQALPAARNRYATPRFSPDGNRISVTVSSPNAGGTVALSGDLWVWDIRARNFQRITFDTSSGYADWTPDGKRLVYGRFRAGTNLQLYRILTDGSSQPESLLARPAPIYESSLSLDGKIIVFREASNTNRDILVATLDSPRVVRGLLVTPFDERNPALSPDGRWVAYVSNETGATEVYVRGLAEGSGRTRISLSGGTEPVWSRTGRELFYRASDSIYVVSVAPGAELRHTSPRALFGGRFLAQSITNWDVSPDGERFVFVRSSDATLSGTPMRVVLNWFDQLRTARK
jgi:eukaryotic-like serine/threonine-protein kinase